MVRDCVRKRDLGWMKPELVYDRQEWKRFASKCVC